MTRDSEVLARAAAARLLAAACREQGDLWSYQEQLHVHATTTAEALAAARPLLQFCDSCPIVAECRYWASVDDYSGIAAGAAWSNGREKSVGWVRQHPLQRVAS